MGGAAGGRERLRVPKIGRSLAGRSLHCTFPILRVRCSSAGRLDGLLDEPRPGAPRTVSDKDVSSLEQTIRQYLDSNNPDPKPFVWTKDRR